MKRLLFPLILLCFVTLYAQTPEGFSYQAVVRNSAGQLIANRNIGLLVTIHQGSATGAEVFSEVQTVTTNAYGLFSTVIGLDPAFTAINWYNGPYFIRSRVDLEGGNNYTLETVQQIFSVPYAIHAQISDSIVGGAIRREVDPVFTAWDKDYNDLINTPVNVSTFVNDAGYITSYTEVQVLSISHDTIFLTGGSFVVLPAGFDGDYNSLTNVPTNVSTFANDAGYLTSFTEVQALSISNDTIFLTGGSYVVLPVGSERQDLASVVSFGNQANGYQIKNVADPTDPQDAITLHYLDSVWRSLGLDSVQRGTYNNYVVSACDSFSWHGNLYTHSGTYNYAYANPGGYFSSDTLDLTVKYGTYNAYTVSASTSYLWHGNLYNSTGNYTFNYINANGCPSVDTLKLTITSGGGCISIREVTDTASVSACGFYPWYSFIITNTGDYQYDLGNIGANGCDSIVKIHVDILPQFQKDTAIRTLTPITWRGNTYSVQGDYGDTLTDVRGCDSIYLLHLMIRGSEGIGGAPGRYSVGPNRQVLFSHGNLLYQSSINKWMFAKNQYDIYGINCNAAYYPTKADIFGWATSGYHDVADTLNVHYRPWSHSNVMHPIGSPEYYENQYGYGPSHSMSDTSLIGSSQNYDWGMYNPIINGGNGAGLWRTLEKDEWEYLLSTRANASNLKSLARIQTSSGSYTNGYIILADNWTCPPGVTFSPNATSFSANSYTLTQWEAVQDSGAIFLPVMNNFANYWTATSGGTGGAYCLSISSATVMLEPYNRSNDYYVRLAQDVVPGAIECTCTYFDTTIVATGSSFNWHGQTYTQTGDYMEALVNNAGCDSIITFPLILVEPGVLNGRFSVSDTHQVRFSKGNLQYKASNNVWRFAIVQYAYVGQANKYVDANYSDWIDLFGWATSGYHDPTDVNNTSYQPWSMSGGFGPSVNMSDWNLVNTSANYDWGVYDTIPNGGNQAGSWRTLSYEEWYYLLSLRPQASSKRGAAVVNGVNGYLLLPDNWTAPSGLLFVAGGNNVYDGTDWLNMEAAGAVFLPLGGWRYSWDTPTYYVGEIGYYWTSSSMEGSAQDPGYFEFTTVWGRSYSSSYAASVRLVKD